MVSKWSVSCKRLLQKVEVRANPRHYKRFWLRAIITFLGIVILGVIVAIGVGFIWFETNPKTTELRNAVGKEIVYDPPGSKRSFAFTGTLEKVEYTFGGSEMILELRLWTRNGKTVLPPYHLKYVRVLNACPSTAPSP